ncbi:hypothetical protein TREPR_2857 [Treponema primitia ZAS-2]|uniref:Uncharacterized protein n=1 Tax=Treponema primitia (strain ATCC BAA-887 / DSM 12427 / ZAS-2) TaxID=545694 RepID=F5YPT8_TREPZ|nr:hypothetical protein TREPR_2857 [Treponema primitia ZAS-2]
MDETLRVSPWSFLRKLHFTEHGVFGAAKNSKIKNRRFFIQ